MKNVVLVLFLVACQKSVPSDTQQSTGDDAQCTAFTSCNVVDSGLVKALVDNGLAQALLPFLPAGSQGLNGDRGDAGQKGDSGPQGDAGPQGPQGLPGMDGSPGMQGQQGFQGDTGPQGVKGNRGDTGQQGALGNIGSVGPTGPQGQPGPAGTVGATGQSNTAPLTATRVFNAGGTCTTPPCDYTGTTTVNSTTVFVPPLLNVVFGSQGVGTAFVMFSGTAKCTYTGNNKSGNALAVYTFTSCVDTNDNVLTLGPGQPFAFTGSITVQFGDGNPTNQLALQVVAFFQIQ